MSASSGKRRDRWDGNVVAKQEWRGANTATSTIENDVVSTGCECEVDVVLDMVCAELETDRNAPTDRPNSITKSLEVFDAREVGKGGRRDRCFARFQSTNFSNLSDDLCPG